MNKLAFLVTCIIFCGCTKKSIQQQTGKVIKCSRFVEIPEFWTGKLGSYKELVVSSLEPGKASVLFLDGKKIECSNNVINIRTVTGYHLPPEEEYTLTGYLKIESVGNPIYSYPEYSLEKTTLKKYYVDDNTSDFKVPFKTTDGFTCKAVFIVTSVVTPQDYQKIFNDLLKSKDSILE